jgi:hypothetical protein
LTRDAEDSELARRLAALPELAPPPEAWSRIEAAAAAAQRRRRRLRQSIGVAASFVAAALALGLWLRAAPELEPGADAPQARAASGIANPITYDTLLAESARLERLLYELPRRGRVMNAATAGTIVGLEDRVALIDERLGLAAVGGAGTEYRDALWRERVDVMHALVQVRYAQAQDLGF